jgi:flagellar capping protein FliD
MATKESIISKDSKISIGLVTALMLASLTGSLWVKDKMQATSTALLTEVTKTNTQLLLMNSRLEAIEKSVDTKYEYLEGYIESRFKAVNKAIDDTLQDRIYKYEFLSWLELLEARNEGIIEVPKLQ